MSLRINVLRSPPIDQALAAGIARMDTSYTEALVIGAGPAGLFAACELVRHGVKPRVVERRLAPHGEARGTALAAGGAGNARPRRPDRAVPSRGRAHQANPASRSGFAGDRERELR